MPLRSRVLNWPRAVKLLLVMLLDACMAVSAVWVAFSLRLDVLHSPVEMQWMVYGVAPILAIPVFIKFGLYRAIFRYTGLTALLITSQAVMVYGLLLCILLLWHQWPGVPRTIGLLQPLLFLILIGGSRALARFWLSSSGRSGRNSAGTLLIYGAGAAGVQSATAIGITGQYRIIGFIDDDAKKRGRSINGTPVFSASDVSAVVDRLQVSDILLALPSATRERRNAIIKSLHGLPVHVRTLPAWEDLASGRVTVRDFRELDVEDLLGRAPVAPDVDLIARDLTGGVVMITGAGGSIGSELCRQIVLQRPRQVLLVEHSEFALYAIHNELSALCQARDLEVRLVALLGSVVNYSRMAAICRKYQPSIVYHAAAYKHVPMVENNAGEGVINNVYGTLCMARAALESSVVRFVLISTDKAVRPTNIMGASKRIAELVLQGLAAEGSPRFEGSAEATAVSTAHKTCFTMVRFGNVLDSSGSVVPLFRRQLIEGGPLTVTHPEVTRYFMTIPEAAQLVLQAGAMAVGGDVFVLDMGEPVKILDLARRMIELSGLSVRDDETDTGDIQIKITGLRPGEKLYEELLIGDNPESTAHPRIMKAREPCLPWSELCHELEELRTAAEYNDIEQVKSLLKKLVHGYQPA
ncbi:nucleoside-diphosphate sugar epimerase/dehydratase [Polaromonas sp. YR568]|uniref:polysaccharide biosynthesis protein n=1 Tax=Polaromonas sp. YR568 TaxID=1855301 RepID=UPI0031380270